MIILESHSCSAHIYATCALAKFRFGKVQFLAGTALTTVKNVARPYAWKKSHLGVTATQILRLNFIIDLSKM